MTTKKSEKFTVEVYQGEPVTGEVDRSQARQGSVGRPSDDVQGHGKWLLIQDPFCGNCFYAYVDKPGDLVIDPTSGNCFRVWF